MKKLYALIIFSFFLFISKVSFAQSFTFVHPDTSNCGVPGSDVECFLGDSLINNITHPLAVDVKRVQDVTTANWTSAFCLNVCYLPATDSVRFTLAASQRQPFIVHFYTDATTPGTGTVLFKITDVGNPTSVAYQYFHAATTCTGINEPFVNSASVTVYPSPLVAGNDFSMNILNVKNGSKEISLLVYNIYGSVVSKINNLKEGSNTLNLNLPAGIYSYCVTSGNAPINSGKLAVSK